MVEGDAESNFQRLTLLFGVVQGACVNTKIKTICFKQIFYIVLWLSGLFMNFIKFVCLPSEPLD